MSDHIDRLGEEWARERPDLDMRPMVVVGRILRVAALIGGEIDWFARDRGISRAEGDVILTLRRIGAPYELTEAELSSALMLTAGGLTQRLDELRRNGLVEIRGSLEADGSDVVALTERGQQLVDEMLPDHVANENRLLEPLDDHEREALSELLARVSAPLEARR